MSSCCGIEGPQLTPRSSPSPIPHALRASDAFTKSALSLCSLPKSHETVYHESRGHCMTHEFSTDFSAVISSCSVRRSLFTPKTGIVELCAIFFAAVLNIAANKIVQRVQVAAGMGKRSLRASDSSHGCAHRTTFCFQASSDSPAAVAIGVTLQ